MVDVPPSGKEGSAASQLHTHQNLTQQHLTSEHHTQHNTTIDYPRRGKPEKPRPPDIHFRFCPLASVFLLFYFSFCAPLPCFWPISRDGDGSSHVRTTPYCIILATPPLGGDTVALGVDCNRRLFHRISAPRVQTNEWCGGPGEERASRHGGRQRVIPAQATS